VRVAGDHDGMAVTCGKYVRILAVDPERRGRGIGSALLRDAEERGATTIAAEPGNYFTPGVIDTDATTLAFLRNRGYRETASTHNLEAPLADLPSSDARRAGIEERDRVLAFIEQHFGRIWRFEAARAFEADPPTLFVVEENGQLAGFAAHDANNRGLGFFGPTGVDPTLRGRGLGRRLLLASLADLALLGFSTAVIPWTDALEFYAKSCGARVVGRFVTVTKG
jgi:GNAT superfamily N-acetyltransferase